MSARYAMARAGFTATGPLAGVIGAAVLMVACGGSEPSEAPVTTAVAPRPVQGIAPTEKVAGRYSLDGRERRIRVAVTPTLITRKRRADYVVVPRGRSVVQVDLRLDDTGRDRLDLRVASFSAVDSAGSRVHEAFRLPVREFEPGAANSARVVSVGFLLRRARTIAALRMRSILAQLPLRLRWALDEPRPRT